MNRLIAAVALTPMFLVSGVFAQTVSDDVAKQLWCGTAFSIAFAGEPPPDISPEDAAQGKVMYDGGLALIALAEKAHLDAGFTQEAIDKIKADLVTEVTPVVSGESQNAKYTFEDCIAILPAPADGATDTSSSAQ